MILIKNKPDYNLIKNLDRNATIFFNDYSIKKYLYIYGLQYVEVINSELLDSMKFNLIIDDTIVEETSENLNTSELQNLKKTMDEIDLNLIYNLSEKATKNKFFESMSKEVKKLSFSTKKEDYKRYMKKVSTAKSDLSSLSIRSSNSLKSSDDKICKKITKKGKRCTNKAIKNSDFCGIASHNS